MIRGSFGLMLRCMEASPELVAEIEEAMSIPVGTVQSVDKDGRVYITLNEEGYLMVMSGMLELD